MTAETLSQSFITREKQVFRCRLPYPKKIFEYTENRVLMNY